MIKDLPQDFKLDMEKLLGKNAQTLFLEYDKPPYRGLRINTLKCSPDKLKKLMPGKLSKNPFSKFGYYLMDDANNIGNSPLHHAGAFYVQEPSAMSAVTLLDVKENDIVLDLCAAPGGKSTQIAAYLNNTGLLWCNEIVKSRANILLSNIERCGIKNAVVSCEPANHLCNALAGFFDKVLVDAPCSGEGMFRKSAEAIKQWSRDNVMYCKTRQLDILDNAALAVKNGGYIVYSTCTFSYEENEEVTSEFLKRHPEFSAVESNIEFGRKTNNLGVRIFPMDGGEGHYAVKFVRNKENEFTKTCYNYPPQEEKKYACLKKQVAELEDKILRVNIYGYKFIKNNNIFLLPENMPDFSGINILRAGIIFAEIKANRIEPHHSLFMSLKPDEVKNSVSFPLESDEIKAFLHGEELATSDNKKGACLVAVEGISVGFAKAANGRLKNKYPKGLRIY